MNIVFQTLQKSSKQTSPRYTRPLKGLVSSHGVNTHTHTHTHAQIQLQRPYLRTEALRERESRPSARARVESRSQEICASNERGGCGRAGMQVRAEFTWAPGPTNSQNQSLKWAKSRSRRWNSSRFSAICGRGGSEAFFGGAASLDPRHAGVADPRFVIHTDVEFHFCAPWRREPQRERAKERARSAVTANMIRGLSAHSKHGYVHSELCARWSVPLAPC